MALGGNKRRESRMIDKHDIAILRKWLKLAQAKGTDAIKIVAGNKPNTYIVSLPAEKGVIKCDG